MEEPGARTDNDKFLDNSTDNTDVTWQRDKTEIDLSAANEDCNTAQLCKDLQIEVTSRNSETVDTVGSNDPCDKLLDNRKCTCIEDSAFLSRPAGDLRKACCTTIGEEECRICQSSGEEVLISPCKCAGSTK